MDYDWPGNVGELENVIKGTVLTNRNKRALFLGDFPQDFLDKVQREREEITEEMGLKENELRLDKGESELIKRVLKLTNENKTKAAKILGIARQTLQNKIKEYGIKMSKSGKKLDI